MTIESEDEDFSRDMPAMESAAALGLALAIASREKADAFLDAQTEILRIQREDSRERHDYEASHLFWRRFNDQMKGAMQIMAVALGLLVVIAIAAAVWNASQSDGLVVDAFTAPPSLVARGIGGDVIAADLTSRIGAVRNIAMAHSYSVSRDVSAARANEIKLEIPETGVSISEAWRTLRGWLGHERHLTGSARDAGPDAIEVSASLDGTGLMIESGPAKDLPQLEQALAEKAFCAFDPVNCVNYFTGTGRKRQGYEAAERFVPLAQTPIMRADSYALLSYTYDDVTGDLNGAVARARVGISIDPAVAVDHIMVARASFYLGDLEEMLNQDRIILSLRNADQPPGHQGAGFAEMQAQAGGEVALLQGDFGHAEEWSCGHSCSLANRLAERSALAAHLHDPSGAAALLDAAVAAATPDRDTADAARAAVAAERGDWNGALSAAKDGWITLTTPDHDLGPRYQEAQAAAEFAPQLALAYAHLGRFDDAAAVLDKTPADCVPCETARGEIARLKGDTGAAATWFARAIHDGRSIPFAYADWGAMLLAEGKLDAAMAKFERANAKGPHFADPLEMWGEALIRENHSDLALAKFEDANTDAPRWGRLHLKWGEALLWLGRRDEAQRQFATAASLFLTPKESSELARVRSGHG